MTSQPAAPRPLLSEKPIAFVDCETTGLLVDTHEMLELAIVFDSTPAVQEILKKPAWAKIPLRFKDDYAIYTTKIKPQRLDVAEAKALEINGYSARPGDWENAPTFETIADTVATLLENVILCGHNVRFDAGFLSSAFQRIGKQVRVDYHICDTVTLAYEHLVPWGLTSLSLNPVCTFLNISNDGSHTAQADALRARACYQRLSRATVLQRAYWGLRARLRGQTSPSR